MLRIIKIKKTSRSMITLWPLSSQASSMNQKYSIRM